jgi:hypothetical protein
MDEQINQTKPNHITCFYYQLWIQSTSSCTISLKSNIMLSFHRCLGVLNGLLPSGFPIKTLQAFLFYSTHVTCPTHLILHNSSTWIIFGDVYKCFSLRTLLQLFVTFFILYLNVFLSSTFLITFIQCSSLNGRDRVWHPYETITTLCISVFMFLVSK